MALFGTLIGPATGNESRDQSSSKKWHYILTYSSDWIVTIVLLVITGILTSKSGFKREFSLTDTSIQHTYAEHERIPFWLDIVLAGAVPAVIIVLIGSLRYRNFWDVHNGLLALLLSISVTTVITGCVKIAVGRPRPDLIDRCQPYTGATDSSPYGLSNVSICTTAAGHKINDGFKSFPSGHTSFAFAGLGFLSLYLCGKMHVFGIRAQAVKTWIALVPLLGAAMIAISRTMDYRHHPTDVLIGGLLGSFVTYYIYHLYYPPLSSRECHLPYEPKLSSEEADHMATAGNHYTRAPGQPGSNPFTSAQHSNTFDTSSDLLPLREGALEGTAARPGLTASPTNSFHHV